VSVNGVPAKPQYPLRGSDGRGSLVSHRHIMQPPPWHRKKMPPHLVMRAWEKHSIQHVAKGGFGARIGTIEGKWPPSEAGSSGIISSSPRLLRSRALDNLHSHDGHMAASINASAGSPPKPANACSEATFHVSRLTRPTNPTAFRETKVLPALKRSN
jgi:hypothetical protein